MLHGRQRIVLEKRPYRRCSIESCGVLTFADDYVVSNGPGVPQAMNCVVHNGYIVMTPRPALAVTPSVLVKMIGPCLQSLRWAQPVEKLK